MPLADIPGEIIFQTGWSNNDPLTIYILLSRLVESSPGLTLDCINFFDESDIALYRRFVFGLWATRDPESAARYYWDHVDEFGMWSSHFYGDILNYPVICESRTTLTDGGLSEITEAWAYRDPEKCSKWIKALSVGRQGEAWHGYIQGLVSRDPQRAVAELKLIPERFQYQVHFSLAEKWSRCDWLAACQWIGSLEKTEMREKIGDLIGYPGSDRKSPTPEFWSPEKVLEHCKGMSREEFGKTAEKLFSTYSPILHTLVGEASLITFFGKWGEVDPRAAFYFAEEKPYSVEVVYSIFDSWENVAEDEFLTFLEEQYKSDEFLSKEAWLYRQGRLRAKRSLTDAWLWAHGFFGKERKIAMEAVTTVMAHYDAKRAAKLVMENHLDSAFAVALEWGRQYGADADWAVYGNIWERGSIRRQVFIGAASNHPEAAVMYFRGFVERQKFRQNDDVIPDWKWIPFKEDLFDEDLSDGGEDKGVMDFFE